MHLNFAENLLYARVPGAPPSQRGKSGKEDSKIAVTEVREGAAEIRDVSWGQLRAEAGQLAAAMKAHGVGKGDRVVVVASNSVDTLKVFLACTWVGGLFSSSSTDMGVKGVLQRALQVAPKVINGSLRNPSFDRVPRKYNTDENSLYSWTTLQFTTGRE